MLGFLGQMISVGAHAVGLATHATPAMRGEDLTEIYLTQPAVMAAAVVGPLEAMAMINLEGLTLRRGELNASVWGEGYVDRRHPHTYLHEAVLTYATSFGPLRASLTAGRGFAPFGSDDPMVRPFVKYPSNHHLAQILERWVVIGALRGGPVIVEGGLFNGAEPTEPEDFGDPGATGDSWSARVTVVPFTGIELQASRAEVASPETPGGGGLDHTMWHVAARASRRLGNFDTYALVEFGDTREGKNGVNFFFYETVLAEAAAARGRWQLAARFERSVRPEEERTFDAFRAVRPHHDNSILGTTRWTSVALQLSRSTTLDKLDLRPFVEIIRLNADALDEFPVIDPESLYGSSRMWSFSVGIRSTLGSWHDRMGRYGVARAEEHVHHH